MTRTLTPDRPTVTLTRVQSGVGALTVEAACSAGVGDIRLGCGYQLTSGTTSLLEPAGGVPTAPVGSRRPIIVSSSGQFQTLTFDLRQNRSIDRAVIFAYSAAGTTLSWAGTLVTRTHGGARIDVPLARTPGAGVLAVLTIYNIDGQMVLRAENDLVDGTLRQACEEYGFDRIAWLDERTPLD